MGGRGERGQRLLVLGAPVRPGSGPHLVEVAQPDRRAGEHGVQELQVGGRAGGVQGSAEDARRLGEPLRGGVGAAYGCLELLDRDAGAPYEAPRVVRARDGQVGGLVEPTEQVPQVRGDLAGEAGERVDRDRQRRRLLPQGQGLGAGGVVGEAGGVLLVQPPGVQVEGTGRGSRGPGAARRSPARR